MHTEAASNIRDYHGDWGDLVWGGALKDPEAARQQVSAFEAAGCDELILVAAAPKVDQAERLAEVVL